MHISRTALVVFGLALLASGCGSGKHFEFADTVEGTLTLDDKPVPDAHVFFIPEPEVGSKAPSSYAITDAQGRFHLNRDDNDQPGAVVGMHRVIVVLRPSESRDQATGKVGTTKSATLQLPSVYQDPTRTPLKMEVTKERKRYDLKLTRRPLQTNS